MKLCFLTDHACILVIESFVDINPCFRDLLLHIKPFKYEINARGLLRGFKTLCAPILTGL